MHLLDAISALRKAMEHRPLHSDTPAFEQFRIAQLKKVTDLQKQYPALNWSEELAYFIA